MTPHSNNGRERLVENLACTEFFTQFCSAFTQLTGLALSLEAAAENEVLQHAETGFSIAGVADSRVPVKIGKTLVATLHTGGVRLAPVSAETFAPVAKALLDSDRSAAEIKAERAAFAKLPVHDAARYEAALAMLKSFAFQLGECAYRLVFANAQHEPEPVRQAKTYIMGHLAEQMSLESVSSEVHVSPFHFCKIFKRATGMTFTDFVNRARVEKAKRMLMRPQARITDVAYDAGFQSLSHFNRSFRRIASESPTEFRSRLREPRGGALMAA
ncbi:MAG: yesS [Verrucomicrobiaceae bacterium]|nr:yesS [Verrucomicrobiaceae bacterium]